MERQVRIKDTQSNNIETYDISSATYGELQSELSDISFEKKRVVVRETRVTLQHKDAKLPDGDFTLYIMPEKTKAANDQKITKSEIIKKLAQLIQDIENLEESEVPAYFETIPEDFEEVRRELNL